MHIPTLALMTAAAVQFQTDTTVNVSPTARLDVRNHAGAIVVRTWNRNAVRVQVEHGSRDVVEIDNRGERVTIRTRRRHGPAIADYQLTVPAGMSLALAGVEAEISVDGVQGAIAAETVEGNVHVRNAGGPLSLSSVEGDITVDGASGSVRINGVDGDVRVTNVQGDIVVETIDSDVVLDGIGGGNVDVSTVDGDVTYRGTIRDGGRYRFVSHDGDVVLHVPAGFNATVSVATYDGDFESDFPVQIDRARAGRRFNFVIGSGSARVELESFDGSIILRRR